MEIKGYTNYLIFKNGAVLSKGSKYNKPKFLKHCFNAGGYKVVNLRDGMGGGCPRFIHRLLAEVYIPNPDNKPFIDHIDRCRTNNSLYNLRWVTKSENNFNKTPMSIMNNKNSTGYRYITSTKTGYRYQRTIKGIKYSKRFKQLDDAIEYASTIK
mgnify:CR=1 FL=1|tara:strand:+ start:19 stop:483 length:465 start_codon:yes stop_codon:yes gene_type:complete